MRRILAASVLLLTVSCAAQNVCNTNLSTEAASRVFALQNELAQVKTGEMELKVPPLIADRVTKLRAAVSDATNATMACAEPSVNPSDLQHKLAQALHANKPAPFAIAPTEKVDPSDNQESGSYGGNLQVQVSRPKEIADVLEIQYTFDIECGVDTLLQIYEIRDGMWIETIRWQAPKLAEISDAFGDFFLTSFVRKPSAFSGKKPKWLLAVAHGTPWCTSRFSSFKIDLLSPGAHATSPRIVWHTARGYSRSDFDITLKPSGNAFELRLNADCMSFDSVRCFERRVIYKYSVDRYEHVHRLTPIALNARGFVSEWIRAPWSEAKAFSSEDTVNLLKKVHDEFNAPSKPDSNDYVSNTYGRVLRCKDHRTFQVEIGSTLEKIVPGKPGGDSFPLPSRYFQVRATGDGYVVLSAPRRPDPSCSGRDLMPTTKLVE